MTIQPTVFLKLSVIWAILLLFFQSIEGKASFPDMSHYNDLKEKKTCNFKYIDKIIGFHLTEDFFRLSYFERSFKERIKIEQIQNQNTVDKYKLEPIAHLDVDKHLSGSMWAFNEPTMKALNKPLPKVASLQPINVLFFYQNAFVLSIVRDVVAGKDIYTLLIYPNELKAITWPVNHSPIVEKCKDLEYTNDTVLNLKYGNGWIPLVQDRAKNLWCRKAGQIPILIPVTFISKIDATYFKAGLSLDPLLVSNLSTKYYFGFNQNLNKIYFATELHHIEESIPDYLPVNKLPDDWHPFLCFDYIYIMTGEWILYFPYFDFDASPLFQILSMAVAPVTVMHRNHFFRCVTGGQTKHIYPSEGVGYSPILTKSQQEYLLLGIAIVGGVIIILTIVGVFLLCRKSSEEYNKPKKRITSRPTRSNHHSPDRRINRRRNSRLINRSNVYSNTGSNIDRNSSQSPPTSGYQENRSSIAGSNMDSMFIPSIASALSKDSSNYSSVAESNIDGGGGGGSSRR